MQKERMLSASKQGSDGEHDKWVKRKKILTVEFLSDVLPTGVMVAWSVGDHTINFLTIIFLISILKIKNPLLADG
jgi:uncharacterized protein (UPF0303 family)